MSKNIPTKINNYNVYNAGDKLLGGPQAGIAVGSTRAISAMAQAS